MVNDLWEEDGKKFDSSKCNSMYSLAIYSGLFAFGGWFVIGFIFNFHIIDLSFYFFFEKKTRNYLNIVTDELENPYKYVIKIQFFVIITFFF